MTHDEIAAFVARAEEEGRAQVTRAVHLLKRQRSGSDDADEQIHEMEQTLEGRFVLGLAAHDLMRGLPCPCDWCSAIVTSREDD